MKRTTPSGSPLQANGVCRRGEMRTPADGGREEGKMRTWIWIGARPAGADGRGGGEALRGEDVAGPWKRTMGEGQRGLPFTPRPGEPSNFFLRLTYFKFYLKIIYPNKYLHIY